MSNRKERRAKGPAPSASFKTAPTISDDTVNILLQHPDRAGPKGKTLFDLAAERQVELDKQNGVVRPPPVSDVAKDPSASTEQVSIGPLGDSILYSLTMAGLHVTLDVLVYSQYREDIVWPEIITRALTALPIFFLIVYLLHVEFSYRFPLVRNLGFLVGSVVAGCYLVYSGNEKGYFYVMQAAPPVGVLWIWSVVEMELVYAVVSAAVVGAWVWWNGLNVF